LETLRIWTPFSDVPEAMLEVTGAAARIEPRNSVGCER
jgi:hypothetical protein